MKKSAMVLAVAACVIAAQAEINVRRGVFWDTEDKTDGINVLSPDECTWRSGTMSTDVFDINEALWTGEDYFKIEYGAPLDMEKLRVGNDYVIGKSETNNASPLRLGAFFGRQLYDHMRMEFVVDNGDAEESTWRIDYLGMRYFKYLESKKPVVVKGKGIQRHEVEYKYIRGIMQGYSPVHGGLKLVNLDTNSTAKILNFKIAPKSAEVCWRYEFDVPFEPERGVMTYQLTDTHELWVNGKLVKEGHKLPKKINPTVDLSKYLKKGKNVVAFKDRFLGGYGYRNTSAELLAEGVVIGSKGEIVRILGSKDWKWAFNVKGNEWRKPGFDAKGWKAAKVSKPGGGFFFVTPWNHVKGFNGINPAHMGVLDVKPHGRRYPVYEYGEVVKTDVNLPSEMKGVAGSVEVVDAESGKSVCKKAFDEKTSVMDFGKMSGGAYWVKWELKRGDEVIDKRKTEIVVAGPIEQKEVAFKDFEKELEKELVKVGEVDFTRENLREDEFIDFRANPLKGRDDSLVTNGKLKYRETGSAFCDGYWFKLPGNLELGKPHLVEVVIPDDKERYVMASIAESYPIAMIDSSSDGGYGKGAASAVGLTGGGFPITGGTKTIRFIYVPGCRRAAISIGNGEEYIKKCNPAAAICVNIYKFKNMPAMKLPNGGNGREFGLHSERYLWCTWTAADAPHEASIDFALREHVGQWVHLYKSTKTYVRALRFMGHNMVMQGAYMYKMGLPMERYCEYMANDGFDMYVLINKMLKQNRINTYFVMEFAHPEFLYFGGCEELSDKAIWEKRGRGIYAVDKNGNQIIGPNGSGINPFSPCFRKGFLEMMRDVYARYDGEGIKGWMFTASFWWCPCISISTMRHLTNNEVTFDDDTIEQFENETGIKLNAWEAGSERFMKRFELLSGKYKKEWADWRVKKIRSLWDEVEKIFTSGKDKWKIMIRIEDSYRSNSTDIPIQDKTLTDEQRAEKFLEHFEDQGFRNSLYGGNVRILPTAKTINYNNYPDTPTYKFVSENSGMEKLIRTQDALYSGATGLNEACVPRAGTKQSWWFIHSSPIGKIKRPAGEWALAKETRTIRNYAPQMIVDNWIDCNQCLSHDVETRRFLQAFYSTPQGDWKMMPAPVEGVHATHMDDYVRLVNVTTNDVTLSMKFSWWRKGRDIVDDVPVKSGEAITLKPMTQRVFKLPCKGADVKFVK